MNKYTQQDVNNIIKATKDQIKDDLLSNGILKGRFLTMPEIIDIIEKVNPKYFQKL